MSTINTIEYRGEKYILEYFESDSFDSLDKEKIKQLYGVCFYNEKLLIGKNIKDNSWSLLGGKIEKNESFDGALRREIQEESNMKIIDYKPIGYQTVKKEGVLAEDYIIQLRYFCTIEPYGPFVSDPAGLIIEIKLINPSEYKQYFDWGEIGDKIITKACSFM